MTFMVHDNPNFFFTDDVQVFDNSIGWYDPIRDNSYSLNDGSGHNMSSFIEGLYNKISLLRKRIRSASGKGEY